MRVSTRKTNQNKNKNKKVAFRSKDVKKTPPKPFAKSNLLNKASIMSNSKSCNESTDESDWEVEEIPYVFEII